MVSFYRFVNREKQIIINFFWNGVLVIFLDPGGKTGTMLSEPVGDRGGDDVS